MKPGYLILLSLLAFTACKEKETPPAGLLPVELMQEVLVELHVADAYTERNRQSLVYRNNLREDLYREVLTHFNVSEADFRTTYNYYISHPDLMDSLYQRVIVRLESQQEGVKKSWSARPTKREPDAAPPARLEDIPLKAPWQTEETAQP